MPAITLPDNSVRRYDHPVSIAEIAQSIGAGLAKAALAGEVDGKAVDTSFEVDRDAHVRILTDRDPEGLEVIRHSTAHLLAQAVKELFPEAQVTIGPVIEDGFYYDFAYKRAFTPEDLEAIEKKMEELAARDFPVARQVMPREEAIEFFMNMGEAYKAKIIEDLPKDEVDLPVPPGRVHRPVPRPPRAQHRPAQGLQAHQAGRRLLARRLAQRDAAAHLRHRLARQEGPQGLPVPPGGGRKARSPQIGKQLDLFHTQEEAPGMVFWHPKGWAVYRQVEQYIRELMDEHGYQEIHTPQLVDRSLWEKSGHWDKFGDDMFTTEAENRHYAIKPMNCPCHVQIFNQGVKSYRDLPLRLAEFGSCHRNEPSGTLHGLMRLRNFVQDDAHIFCAEDDIQQEVSQFIDLLFRAYGDFGFHDIIVKLSTRPENRVGDDALWDKAEHALEQALNAKGLDWDLQPGEGAFYGPKIEFSLRDCLERVWQCGTIQVDFSMPGRLDAHYVAEDGAKRVPVMLHRAILGSLERFIGILIEEFSGAFPVWLAPVQAVVLTITDRQDEYASSIENQLKKQGFRAQADLRNEKISFKIREHTLQRVPYLLVVGDREVQDQTVAVRTRKGEDLGVLPLSGFSERLAAEVSGRARTV